MMINYTYMENIPLSKDKNNQPGINLDCNKWMPVDALCKNTIYPWIDIWHPEGVDAYGDEYNAHRKVNCSYDGNFWYNGEILRKPVSHYMLIAEPK